MKSSWKQRRVQQQQTGGETPDILVLVMARKSDEDLERIAREGGHSRLKDTARRILEERREQTAREVGA